MNEIKCLGMDVHQTCMMLLERSGFQKEVLRAGWEWGLAACTGAGASRQR